MKEHITVAEIVNMLLRRWWIIVLSAMIFSVSVFFYSEYIVIPLYKTTGSILVASSLSTTGEVSQQNLVASQQLATTCKELLTRPDFLRSISEEVKAITGHEYPNVQLKEMIEVEPVNETEIIEITVKGSERKDLPVICNLIITKGCDEIKKARGGYPQALDLGRTPGAPYSPNTRANTLLFFFIGICVGGLIVFCIDFFDTRVKSRDDLTSKYRFPLLGEIPELAANTGKEDGYTYTYRDKGGKKE